MLKFYEGANKVLSLFLITVISLYLVLTAGIIQAQTLVINDTNGPPFTTPEGDGFLDIIAGKAFKQAGLTLKLIRTPPERALQNANAGIDDGELTRIKGINKTYTNLVRVPEKIIDWNFVALTRNQNISVHDWNDLRKYRIGFIRGWKILENNTLRHQNVSIVRSPRELFAMLDKDRIDIALYSKWAGIALVKKHNIKNIRVLEPPLAMREMYIYLNKKHIGHVTNISSALKKMKDSGEYQKIFNQKIEQPYNN